MKIRTLAILLIIFGILVGLGALIIYQKAPERSQEALGKQLFEQLPANEIASIIIKGPEEAVSLVKKVDNWVVENRFDYPADFSKIADFVRKLKEVKVGRQFESSEDTFKRLSLKDPDDPDASEKEKGIRVLLKDKGGIVLVSILLGKARKKEDETHFVDGQYVRLGQGLTIYLIGKHFAPSDKAPSAWLEKSLVRVKPNQIKKISCLSIDGKKSRYIFERPEKGKDFEPVSLSAGRKVKKSALNRVARALSSLQIEDVVEPLGRTESVAREFSSRLEYQLFDGMIYRVYPGIACSDTKGCYLRLDVDYQRPSPEKKETAVDASPKKGERSPEKTHKEQGIEAKQLNERLSPWVYVIPEWQHSAFITNLAQLLEKPEKEKPES